MVWSRLHPRCTWSKRASESLDAKRPRSPCSGGGAVITSSLWSTRQTGQEEDRSPARPFALLLRRRRPANGRAGFADQSNRAGSARSSVVLTSFPLRELHPRPVIAGLAIITRHASCRFHLSMKSDFWGYADVPRAGWVRPGCATSGRDHTVLRATSGSVSCTATGTLSPQRQDQFP
jgi:hypothetical protein